MLVKTNDGSFTLKNQKYNECYHSSEGAVTESLYKHVFPAFEVAKKFNYYGGEIKILDICFGLGFNTFLSILNRPKDIKLQIFSPELDEDLVRSLKNFPYPKEFETIKHIIYEVSDNLKYEDSYVKIEVSIIDAREYIKSIEKVDIVYQDAFSLKVNPELWTFEYFKDIDSILNPKGVLTSYSVATPFRCALYKLGYNLYTHPYENIRKGTIASKAILDFEKVDFEEKLKRIDCRVLRDEK